MNIYTEEYLESLTNENKLVHCWFENETTVLSINYQNKYMEVYEFEPNTEQYIYKGDYRKTLKNKINLNGREYKLIDIENVI